MFPHQQNHYSPFRAFITKFLKQRVAVVSMGVVILILLFGFLGPMFAPYDPQRPVTEQYAAKGIEIESVTSSSVGLQGLLSDGTIIDGSQLERLSFESENQRVAAARVSEAGMMVSAYRQGSTIITIKSGEVSSIVKADVSSNEVDDPFPSYIFVEPIKEEMNVGARIQLQPKLIISDGKTLETKEQIDSFLEEYGGEAETKDDGFGRPATEPDSVLQFQSLHEDVASVDEHGFVTILSEGEGLIKISVAGVTAVIPVGQFTSSQPVVTAIIPSDSVIALTDIYKHQAPSSLHLFGTDHQNRDILSRIMYGTKQTLLIGFVSVAIGAFVGTILGLLAGYYGRWVDSLLTRFTDILLAFPGILLAIAVIALLGAGLVNIIVAVAVFTIPIFIRIVRASTLALKEKTYVEAAKSIGVKDHTIILRHIFPGTLSVVMVYLTMRVGTAILIGAALSFLGLGGDITAPEWGAMLSSAKDNSRNLFHPTFFPGLAIVITVLSFNLLGDGLRDALDPKLKE
ncbi:ABC transporter permease subunit [Anaerobacillus alkaliphilus]|uniref:Glutathione transport system permease protein GsiD n=1 Tax=Anaerobacillus alkaliphilus TaxID=1548597 RepID=A0A4Q0VWV3_9BACI|nr:ABC transporter permease subunit [Anaerobacillus alkaliphilus]RXJ04217.1 ABC transporter permease subunit [Anaerobacillus alkaliphilus]